MTANRAGLGAILVLPLVIGLWDAMAPPPTARAGEAVPPAAHLFETDLQVRRNGDGFEISFSLARPIDVTVRITDAGGNVVRHLACGMVGLEKAAAPLSANSLRQTLIWDGKDNEGRPAPAAGLRAVLCAGMRARFDRFILWNPDGFGVLGAPNWAYPGAIAVGPRGEVHLVQQYGVHYSVLRVFDRNGCFVRCVWPLSLDKKREVIEPFMAGTRTVWPGDVAPWAASDWFGRTVPRSISHSAFYWYGVRTNAMVVTPEGRIILPDAHVTSGAELLAIDREGLPEKVDFAAPWLDRNVRGKLWDLAIGPDGDLYVSDKGYGIVAHLDARTLAPVNSFTYQGAARLQQPTYMIGTPQARRPGVWDPLRAVAVDKEGRVWLANPQENCIEVFRRDGLPLPRLDRIALAAGEVPIKADAIAIAANHKSGAVYLNMAAGSRRALVKLNSSEDRKAAAELELPLHAMRIAVDSEAGIVWALVRENQLIRVRDTGGALESQTLDGLANRTLTFPRLMSVDGAGRLYLADASSNYVMSDVEGKSLRRLSWYGASGHGYSAVDADGNWYVAVTLPQGRNEVWKLSPDGQRLKFGSRDAIELPRTKEVKGLCIAPNGDVYVAVTGAGPDTPAKQQALSSVDLKGAEYNFSRVDIFGPDGLLKREGAVRLQGINDVKLDRSGRIYAIEAGACHGAHKRRAAKLDNKTFTQFNALMAFAADGGVRDGPGHLWTFRGLSGTSSFTCAGECPAAQLAVDADDRIWIPDPDMYSVTAVDTAGNLMLRVGAYGNEDCRGGGGDEMIPGTQIVRNPEIPLARPFGMAVWKDYLLISDMYAQRVVRCRLEFAEKREGSIPR